MINQQVHSNQNKNDSIKDTVQVDQKEQEDINEETLIKENPQKKLNETQLALFSIEGTYLFSLKDFAAQYNMEWSYNKNEGTIDIKDKQHRYHLLRDTSVISKDGIYLPNNIKPYIDQEENVYLPINMLKQVFELNYTANNDENALAVFSSNTTETVDNSLSVFEETFPTMTEEEIFSYLSFLSRPIQGAHLSMYDSHLPGAARTYRNGVHEGIDWYADVTGVKVDKSTPVLSMADGVVVRSDIDYMELGNDEREEMLNIAKNMNHTPQSVLDILRGRSVWVQYATGVMARYAHLSKVEEGIEVGKEVKTGDIVGYVGNSGTSDGVKENNSGLHLHLDILIYDHLFWEFCDKEQIRDVLEHLFSK